MAVTITFLGGPDCGGVDQTVWGNDATGKVVFPLRVPIAVDPEDAPNGPDRAFLSHLVAKARQNPFFKVEDGPQGQETAKVVHLTAADAPKKRGRPRKEAA